MEINRITELTDFIEQSPTAFHAVQNLKTMMDKDGFQELKEAEKWHLEPDGKYYVTRNNSSIIALKIGNALDEYSFHVTASHSDSPTFKLKENIEINVAGKYTVLNTEGYGGMICSTWFDRPLSLAGRVMVKDGNSIETKLVKINRDLLMIPSLAIHMDRKVNDGKSYNKQIDMLPVLSGSVKESGEIKAIIAKELDVETEDIYGMDLFLYNRMKAVRWGSEEEFIGCPRLDDLECAFTSAKAFLTAGNQKNINVFACFDNEEVGSGTKQGAKSTFLFDVLWRTNQALGYSEEDFYRALAGSFLLSCDNAHAVHPNYRQKTDTTNCTYMNEGIVVKSHAGQKYTSDAVSIAVFKMICEKAGVPVQFFANRSDEAGGSTLGNLAMAQVSMNTVDIGLPQLGMHSAYETAGVKDVDSMIRAIQEFYQTHIKANADGNYILKE